MEEMEVIAPDTAQEVEVRTAELAEAVAMAEVAAATILAATEATGEATPLRVATADQVEKAERAERTVARAGLAAEAATEI